MNMAPSEFKPIPLPADFFPRRSVHKRLWGWWESLCVLRLGRCPRCLRKLEAGCNPVWPISGGPPDREEGWYCSRHGGVWTWIV